MREEWRDEIHTHATIGEHADTLDQHDLSSVFFFFQEKLKCFAEV